jgi:hypothetical protein
VTACHCIFRAGLVLWAVAGSPSIGGQATRANWLRADEATVRLSPSAFPALPSEVRAELERRGCKVPQPANAGQPQNVISGRFTSATASDWAVLCSREKRSAILIFRGGRANSVDELAEEADAQYLQVVAGNGRIGFSRQLAVTSRTVIRRRLGTHGALKPATVDHDGIENNFVGKVSLVWYWSGGKWIQILQTD